MASTNISRLGTRRVWALAALAALAVIGTLFLRDSLNFDTLRDNREALLAFRDSHFGLLALTFVASYVAIAAFSLPGATVASVTGGFLFGWTAGTVLNVAAATLGATALFLAVRWGFGAALSARIEVSDGRIRDIQKGLRQNEVNVMFLLRLVPAVPFFVANLLPALVGVRLRNFVLTTFLGIIPGAMVITWVGVGLGEVFDRGEEPDLSLIWDPQILGPLIALAALAALPILVRAIRANRANKARKGR